MKKRKCRAKTTTKDNSCYNLTMGEISQAVDLAPFRVDGGIETKSKRFLVESASGGSEFWQQNGEDLNRVIRLVSTEFIPDYRMSQEYERLEEDLSDEKTTAVLLREKASNDIAGFTYMYPAREAEWKMNPVLTAINVFREKTAQVAWAAITPKNQKKHGWSQMMDELDKNYFPDGEYEYMIRCVRTDNNYAAKVKRRYSDKIIYSETINGLYGNQKIYVVNFRR